MEMVHFIPPHQRRLALLAAQAESAPVLIHGSSGTGKGAIARWIHVNSPRSLRPLHYATLEQPLASQIAAAQSGTLVIPEIGTWGLAEQKILLQFLNTKSISMDSLRMLLNVRIIATTSQPLDSRANAGLFNPDLLTRLSVFRLEMPPLSRRGEELADIALGLLGEITREFHKEHLRTFSPEAWDRLRTYDWPGNIRELRNVLRVAVISARGDRIEATDFPAFGGVDFRATREDFEKNYLVELLGKFDWQVDEACRMTRMDKGTLLTKIQKYGIDLTKKMS